MISPPFNFYHMTHTQRHDIPELHRLSHTELATEFHAVQQNQMPRQNLNGIRARGLRADDPQNDGYATDEPRSSPRARTSPTSKQRKTPPIRPKRSDELLDEAAAEPSHNTSPLGHARSAETFDYVPPSAIHSSIAPVPPPPRIPPPRRSSRPDWQYDDKINSLHVPTSQHAVAYPRLPNADISPNTFWNTFSATGFSSPIPPSANPYAAQYPEMSPHLQPLPIQPYADDPLLSPMYGKELERVLEEPEDVGSRRASQALPLDNSAPPPVLVVTNTSPAMASDVAGPVSRSTSGRSAKALSIATPGLAYSTDAPLDPRDSLVPAPLSAGLHSRFPLDDDDGEVVQQSPPRKPLLARMNSNASDTLGGPIHRRFPSRTGTLTSSPSNTRKQQLSGIEQNGSRSHIALTEGAFYDDENINWEDDVDYCYDHHMEAHCDLDWNNTSRLDMSSSDEEDDVPELDNSVPSVNSIQDVALHQPFQRGQSRPICPPSPPETSGEGESFRGTSLLSDNSQPPTIGLGILPSPELDRASVTRARGSAELPLTPDRDDFTFPSRKNQRLHNIVKRQNLVPCEVHTPWGVNRASLLLPEDFDFQDQMTRDETYEEILNSYDSQSRCGTYEEKYYAFLEHDHDLGNETDYDDLRPRTSYGVESPKKQDWSRFSNDATSRKSFRASQLLPLSSNPGHKRKSASVDAIMDFAALGMPEKSLHSMDEGIQLLPESDEEEEYPGIKLLPESSVEGESPTSTSSSLKIDTIVAQLRSQLASHLSSPSTPPPEAAMASDHMDIPAPAKKIISAPAIVAAPSPRLPMPPQQLHTFASLPTPPMSAPPIPRSHSRSPSSPARFLAPAKPPTPPLHRKVSSESTTTDSRTGSSAGSNSDTSGSSLIYATAEEIEKILPPEPPAPKIQPKNPRRKRGSTVGPLKSPSRTSFSLFPSPASPGIASVAAASRGRLRAVHAL